MKRALLLFLLRLGAIDLLRHRHEAGIAPR
jgi:hypothetical protein